MHVFAHGSAMTAAAVVAAATAFSFAQPAATPQVAASAQPAPVPAAASATEEKKKPADPWRLDKAAGFPDWLQLRFEQRTRYEYLEDRFRRGFIGTDQGLYLRNRIELTLKRGIPQATFELMDSRQEFADDGSGISANDVNAVELLQAFGALNLEDVFTDGDKLFIQGGRMTINLGTRRLVARNEYRNNTNAFTGVNAVWTHSSGAMLQGFWTLPIDRLPADRESFLNNEIVFDQETFEVQFWGAVGRVPNAIGRALVEGFIFGLHEDDGERQTRNRELYTVGGRIGAPAKAGEFDFEVESALQFGTSRSTAAVTNTRDLDHLAYFQHAEVGYTFKGDQALRVNLQFDYASGDEKPNDDENNRFDTLYGARRFDFGPTGNFGPFARANLVTPGYRVAFRPFDRWDVMFAHRFYWLADSSDQFTTAGLQDATGNSGSYLGHMPEIRLGWNAIPGNLHLETGVAYLFKGEYFDRVPNSPGDEDIAYVYFQSTISF